MYISHLFTHLRKCHPPKKVLIINNYHLSVRFQRKFLKIWFIYQFWRLTDYRSCQPPALSAANITQNQGTNIFSSSKPLYKLPIPICEEIIQLNNTDIFWPSATKSTHFMNEMVADMKKFTFMGFIFG